MKQPQSLNYLLAEKNGFLVVTFLGVLTEENSGIINQCCEEIVKFDVKYCVFNFHDIIEINVGVIPSLMKLQRDTREKIGELRICSLKPSFKNILFEKKAIRPEEQKNSLLEAWIEFFS